MENRLTHSEYLILSVYTEWLRESGRLKKDWENFALVELYDRDQADIRKYGKDHNE